MMRQIRLCLLCLLAGASLASAQLLVNTRLNQSVQFASDETLELELRDYFQMYAEPGPVATFSLYMPVQDGVKSLLVDYSEDPVTGEITPNLDEDGPSEELMSYKLLSGGTYTNAYEVMPSEFEWAESSVQYQLLAGEAPVTVANFMTYVQDGAYQNTIVHRSEISVVQAGGIRLYEDDPGTSEDDDYIIQWIDVLPQIAFEQTRTNTEGTLAMARQSNPNSASSQFFINLADNSSGFRDNYSVFGELLDLENSLPVLQEMGDVRPFPLTKYFPTAPMTTTPLYTPFWDDQGSYVRFPSITVPEGDPDGITYSVAFIDYDGVEGTSDEEAANQAVFDVSISGSTLSVSRTDTGVAAIEVTGTSGDQTSSFKTFLVGFNPDALEAFPASEILQGGWLENFWFGFLVADDYPYIQHFNHGHQYVVRSVVPDTGAVLFYLYDYSLGTYLYTTATSYPYLYAYSLGSWVYYQEGSGNGADIPRWIYNYATGEWFQG